MLAYIVVYSALAADSPSLVMIQQIADAGAAGLSHESLLERANARGADRSAFAGPGFGPRRRLRRGPLSIASARECAWRVS